MAKTICLYLLLGTLCLTVLCHAEGLFKSGYEQWEPYEFKDQNNHLTGLDVELLQAIAGNMNYTINFIETPWKRAINMIEYGRIDVLAGATITEDRKRFAQFSQSYRKESFLLFVLKSRVKQVSLKKLSDIVVQKIRLGVVRGYYYGEEYKQLIKDPEFKKWIQDVGYDYLNFDKLIRGRIDAFIGEPFVTICELKKRKLLDQVSAYPLEVFSSNIHFMFSKKSVTSQQIQMFDNSLINIKKSGLYNEIIQKYMK